MRAGAEEDYDLQYAPHHLIPGNESLKGSSVVSFLGDDDTIEEYAEGAASHIKEGFSVGYDVNANENGVWLPSPYALSMANSWPSEPGVKVIKKRLGQKLADDTEDFKMAYVAASIEEGGNRQFHMRHKEYSDKVIEILQAIGARMKLMAASECPIAKSSKKGGKFDPPMGLRGRLDVLSGNLRRLTIGAVWRDPLFTDKLTKDYAEDTANMKRSSRRGRISKVV
jgi:hypothetical protein